MTHLPANTSLALVKPHSLHASTHGNKHGCRFITTSKPSVHRQRTCQSMPLQHTTCAAARGVRTPAPVAEEAPWLCERVDEGARHAPGAAQQVVAVLQGPCWGAGAEAVEAVHDKSSQHELCCNTGQPARDTQLADRTQACQHLQVGRAPQQCARMGVLARGPCSARNGTARIHRIQQQPCSPPIGRLRRRRP